MTFYIFLSHYCKPVKLYFQLDVQNRIRDILSETIQEDYLGQRGDVSEQEILQKLKQQGLVDDLLQQMQVSGGHAPPGGHPATHFTDRDDKLTNLPGKRGVYE